MYDESSTTSFSELHECCIAHIISLTSPKDACRAAAVSLGFRSAADSDTVWEKFLPPNYQEVIYRASSPLPFSNKKQLYFFLHDDSTTLLLDGGKLVLLLLSSIPVDFRDLCTFNLFFSFNYEMIPLTLWLSLASIIHNDDGVNFNNFLAMDLLMCERDGGR